MQQRLQKILAQATSLSRRSAEDAIKKGLVRLNGCVVTRLGTKADPAVDRITLEGKQVRPLGQKIYIAFNKPRGALVSKSDPEGKPLIWDKLHSEMKGILNSAGRLDFDSEGLLILTNDGQLIFKLTHPSSDIWKTYHVKVSGLPDMEKVKGLREGIMLTDGKTKPAKVTLLRKTEKNSFFIISIREGRNRQVRRMFSKIGHPVSQLRRMAVGQIELGNLKPGQWREINKKELQWVRQVRI
ncbi:MAG: hypothetical protein A3I09_02960 [Deltaproteobacteria bacterium RIFCSPLOWO2_02_FULL_47_10]|nr:MAG: hypothetical protein A3I09_02960 [Deltaproteobacteria bacterium RIFCSPLOWO2_02_FULL_47_10]